MFTADIRPNLLGSVFKLRQDDGASAAKRGVVGLPVDPTDKPTRPGASPAA